MSRLAFRHADLEELAQFLQNAQQIDNIGYLDQRLQAVLRQLHKSVRHMSAQAELDKLDYMLGQSLTVSGGPADLDGLQVHFDRRRDLQIMLDIETEEKSDG